MSRRVVIGVTLGYLAVAAVMFGVLLPHVAADCGVPALDARFRWSSAEAIDFAHACGPAGLTSYRQLQLADLAYPAVLATLVIVWTRWLSPRRFTTAIVVGLALTNAGFDYLENLGAWTVLTQPADWQYSWTLTIGPVASVVKNVSGTLALTAVGVLAVLAWVRHAKRRRAEQPAGV